MADPLTVLLDAIHVEAMWWWYRTAEGRYALLENGAYWSPEMDSLIGRNVFWVNVIEGDAS